MRTLELREISKRFGATTALERVSLTARAGEVHAILGENGAGKTTLMRVVYGLVAPDSGEIAIDGRPVAIRSPRDALALGIGMVHQHQMLFESLTVAENVLLASRAERGVRYDARAAAERVHAISDAFGLALDPRARVGELPLGVAQRVEIIKALANEVSVLVLDEPTAVLTPGEVTSLLSVLRRLAESGVAVLFVTHKLYEVREIAARVTVLRRGRVTWEGAAGPSLDVEELARAVVGEGRASLGDTHAVEVEERAPTRMRATGVNREAEVALAVRGVTLRARADATSRAPAGPAAKAATSADEADAVGSPAALDEITFEIGAGEIFAVIGVDGNGQAELARVVAGIDAPDAGSIVARGPVALVPGDRTTEGLVAELPLWENLALGAHRDAGFRRPRALGALGLLDRTALRTRAAALVERFDIRASGIDEAIGRLSGGNQQKAVLARALSMAASVLVARNPTRGLDVGATRFVHDTLRSFRGDGGGVLLISSDLDEALDLADRIGVLFRGRLRLVPRSEATPARLGDLMLGGEGGGAAADSP